MRRSRTVLSIVAVLGLVVALPSVATPAGEDGAHKVTICHATNSATNPWVVITVDDAAFDGLDKNDHQHHESKDGRKDRMWDPVFECEDPPTPGDDGGSDGGGAVGGIIGGVVWNDLDGDGIRDSDEGPLGGVVLELYSETGLVATVTTQDDGSYTFPSVESGTYNIVIPNWDYYLLGDASDVPLDNDFLTDVDTGYLTTGWFQLSGGATLDAGVLVYAGG